MIWFMGYGLDDRVSGQGARGWGLGVRGSGFAFGFYALGLRAYGSRFMIGDQGFRF